eukprot:2437259-Pleurochrysis_carterae.AAC.2
MSPGVRLHPRPRPLVREDSLLSACTCSHSCACIRMERYDSKSARMPPIAFCDAQEGQSEADGIFKYDVKGTMSIGGGEFSFEGDNASQPTRCSQLCSTNPLQPV